ncbi:alcohol dehydrogenase catalytic domain-containing protein [Microbacterium luteolum]|uniref:Alcohol dehydrogenase catalytic domain-containing protein n=1 Tax=Microbacterium luteolum TaxID=69367 RepID=A0ABY7XQC3_MICLT|nr:alcohol dehydrogenase catalytic domain-containing protein [Microbacterium luteolum]WDM44355.1 alcohol dehydrogenase catalytic domain-containing protein [Microbacterium luteolum]
MRIRGAVLTTSSSTAPYGESMPIVVEELDLDPPGPSEVLVQIEAAGICHSDLSVVNGSRPRPLPMLLGHEAAGVVLSSGDEEGRVLVGRRVVMAFLPRCGECGACATEGRLPCERGSAANARGSLLSGAHRISLGGRQVAHHLGVSGFATHAVVDRRSLVPVGDDVPPDIAALLGCAVLTGGGAVLNAARPEAGQTVAVVGLGGVGMAALLVSRCIPGVRVVGVDPLLEKRLKAAELGASEVFDPAAAVDAVKADIVIEAAGSAMAFETAVSITAVGGRTVSVGLPASDARAAISPLTLVAEAREIVGSYLGSAVPSRDIPRFEQLWRDGRLPLQELISARISLDDVNQAMDELASGHAIRQLIEFSR